MALSSKAVNILNLLVHTLTVISSYLSTLKSLVAQLVFMRELRPK